MQQHTSKLNERTNIESKNCNQKPQRNISAKKEADEECEEEDGEEICIVCFCSGTDSFLTPCKHMFHWDCIDQHLSRDSRCPNCQCEVKVLRHQNGSRCKWISYKRPHIDPDPSLFSEIDSGSDNTKACVDCNERCADDRCSQCSFCGGALHDWCGHSSAYGRLCTVCKVMSEPKNANSDPECLPARKRRRLNP